MNKWVLRQRNDGIDDGIVEIEAEYWGVSETNGGLEFYRANEDDGLDELVAVFWGVVWIRRSDTFPDEETQTPA